MYGLLLAIIYLAFISLGLPDSLLGSAWPVMQGEMGVPVSFAGIVSTIISVGTIVSSLLSDRLTKKLGTGLVTAISVFMTAAALYGFGLSSSFWQLCLLAIPYGLGAGAVDAALNNYVALHYSSRHMSWLHCSWGIGASISPFIMGYALSGGLGWQSGYKIVGVLQIVLTAVLFLSLPLCQKQRDLSGGPDKSAVLTLSEIVRIKGIKFQLAAFFSYIALENTTMLWASTYLVRARGIGVETGARYASLFFIGITVGRFISGLISNRVGDRNMIRLGIGIIFVGLVAVWLPVSSDWFGLNGLIIIGLGCAPIYPSIIHSTPANFGKDRSQAIIGVQMASAYLGATTMPLVFGFLANNFHLGLFPYFLFFFAVLLLLLTEKLNRVLGDERRISSVW